MKQGWEEIKMVEACDILTCGVASTPNYVDEEIGIPFLSAQNVRDGDIVLDKYNFITKEFHQKLTTKNKPSKGDILYSRVGAKYGEAGVVEHNFEFSVYVSVTLIRPKKELLNNYFLKNYLNSPRIKDLARKSITSSGVPNLNVNSVREFPVPIPPLPEQQRIVSILDEAFVAIAKAKANAEQNLRNAKELFESYLQGVFEIKGDGWEEKMLGEVLLKTETVDPTKKPNEEFIYLDVSSVNKETKEIENATILLGKDAPSRARKLVRTNDVIFATVRPTHSRVALIPQQYNEQVCSTGYFVLRAKEYLNNNLIYYFLLTNGFNKQMEKLQKGASYPAVTDSEVKGIYISFPKSLSEQITIIRQLDALKVETKKLEAIYQQKINDLDEMKKSILQKAFSGELVTNKTIIL
ncbi:MAG: restriction endonuclease subunit S [Saprospiraceae bacterium]